MFARKRAIPTGISLSEANIQFKRGEFSRNRAQKGTEHFFLAFGTGAAYTIITKARLDRLTPGRSENSWAWKHSAWLHRAACGWVKQTQQESEGFSIMKFNRKGFTLVH
jgi:hypothetical protein